MNSDRQDYSFALEGKVIATIGPLIKAQMPLARLGAQVEVELASNRSLYGIITAFSGDHLTIAPLGDPAGITVGTRVWSSASPNSISLPSQLAGLIIDGQGNSLNTKSTEQGEQIEVALNSPPPPPLLRTSITNQLVTGISAIDSFSPIGIGQRLSLSAPAGSGKSTLLGMITRNAQVDHIVIGLIGERGREVNEFIDEVLGEAGLRRSTIVVATSDAPPILKLRAADTALSISELLRNQGKNVLLIVDSLTRLARAMRDLGLANGEIPVRQGFPASVLVSLPRLLERAGNNQHGSITAIFSLLLEDGHGNDYLSHEVASLLDGHLILDPLLAERGHFPAIDVTKSLSRLTTKLLSNAEQEWRRILVRCLSRLYRERDLLLLGGAADKELETIVKSEDAINRLLTQTIFDNRPRIETMAHMKSLIGRLTYA